MNKKLVFIIFAFICSLEAGSQNIEFVDNEVKAICVSHWDTNGDKELSIAEAAAVTDLSYFFCTQPITSFDELKYFTGLVELGEQTFEACEYLTSIIIPESVTSIGNGAFWGCVNLRSINIPSNVTNIGEGALSNCPGLTSIKVDAGNNVYDSRNDCNAIIATATDELLYGCQETVIPENVTSIGNGAFLGCGNLKAITIPSSVSKIGNYSFAECSSLISLILPEGLISIGDYALTFCSSLISQTIPSSVTNLGDGVFENCNSLTSVILPEGLTNIGIDVFSECPNLTSVTLPQGLVSIGDRAFTGCNIASLTLPEGLTSIGNYAFSGCRGLRNVTLPENLKSIGIEAFAFCTNLTSIDIPSSITSINDGVFFGCSSLTSISIPNSVTFMGNSVFYDCSSLTSVTLPESLTSFGIETFALCSSLTSITIPSNVASIGDYSFYRCSNLTSIKVEGGNEVYDSRNDCNAIIVTATNELKWGCQETVIPEGVTSIANDAFLWCTNLKSITIPSSVKRIGSGAFQDCSSLTNVTISDGVTNIDWGAFYNCYSLTSVISHIEEPFEISSDVFEYDVNNEGIPETKFTSATLYVPVETKEKYEAMSSWNQFQNIVELVIEPMDQDEVIVFASDIDTNTDLDGIVLGDIYYCISEDDGSFDETEGCIVVTTPTDESAIDGIDIYDEDFKANFTGIVFNVAAGIGTIRIDAETKGMMVLKVKIGENQPVEMELEERTTVSIPFDVKEETLVYIYGGSKASQTDYMMHANATDNALKIFGIKMEKGAEHITEMTEAASDDAPIYHLNGIRVYTPGNGIYIKNGKKLIFSTR